MADIFGFEDYIPGTPLTADKATIQWDKGLVTGATQVSISYAQQVNRRRTIGNKSAIIWASLPNGQITIQRLLTTDTQGLFSAAGWRRLRQERRCYIYCAWLYRVTVLCTGRSRKLNCYG